MTYQTASEARGMTEGAAQSAFRQVYPADQPNFMTPYPLAFGWIDEDTVYEISKGSGIYGEGIYGVTVVVRVGGEWKREPYETTRSRCFESRRAAGNYVVSLRGA